MSKAFTPPGPLNTAVLFIVFNRPDTTTKVFEAIRHAEPPRLYVAADGPRDKREGEAQRVARVREIVSGVDWPCEVKTLFREQNLGCKDAVSEAIQWFFEHEEEGIILEDDCVPSQSFFWFCEELLKRYKDDERIFIISGHNRQGKWRSEDCDYFFSFFGGIWGWASWRRAWKYYDGKMSALDSMRSDNAFVKQMGTKLGRLREKQLVSARKRIESGKMDTWDYPWALSRHTRGGLACVPNRNLIRNVGFGTDATHTTATTLDEVDSHELTLPLRLNQQVIPDIMYDTLFLNHKSLLKRCYSYLLRKLKNQNSKMQKAQ